MKSFEEWWFSGDAGLPSGGRGAYLAAREAWRVAAAEARIAEATSWREALDAEKKRAPNSIRHVFVDACYPQVEVELGEREEIVGIAPYAQAGPAYYLVIRKERP
jgi:hypothetical protein